MEETGDKPLSRLLRRWEDNLGDVTPRPWWKTALVRFRRSKWSVAICLVWLTRLGLDFVLASDAEARRIPLRLVSGIYSCTWAILFFAWRSKEASRTIAYLASVAEQLEEWGSDSTKALLAQAARSVRRVSRFYELLGLTQLVGVIQSMFAYEASAVAAILAPRFFAISCALHVSHTLALSSGLLAYYSALSVLFATIRSCSSLYRALGLECARPCWRGEHAIRLMSAQHARLSEAARRARLMFMDLFVHLLSTVLILPLLGTVELIVAPQDVDSMTLTTFAVIGTNFVPICLIGQELEDSSAALQSQLYWGPWLAEDCPGRRMRLQLMLGACHRAQISVSGLGALNASSCLRVVNRWFSFLNAFINIHAQQSEPSVPGICPRGVSVTPGKDDVPSLDCF